MSICLAVIRDHVDVMYEVLLKSQLLHLILKQQTLFTLQVNCKHALVLHKGFCFFMFFNIKKQKPLSQSISVIYLQKKKYLKPQANLQIYPCPLEHKQRHQNIYPDNVVLTY